MTEIARDRSPIQALVEEGAAEALVLRRIFPPRQDRAQATSFLGGRPRLPARLAWPTTADGRGLTFLGQIDLARLPESPCRRFLPGRGALLFFANTSDDLTGVEAPGGAAVLHVEEDPRDLPPRDPPPHVMPACGPDAHFHFPWLCEHRGSATDGPREFPLWPVEVHAMRLYAEAPIFGDELTPAQAEEYSERAEAGQWAAYEAAFGPPALWEYPTWWTEEDRSRLGPDYPLALAERGRLWFPDAAWPYAWIHVQIFAARLLDHLRNLKLRAERDLAAATGDRSPFARRLRGLTSLEAEAAAWHERALKAGPASAAGARDRAAFRGWVERLDRPAASPLARIIGRMQGSAVRDERLPDLGPERVNRMTEQAFVAGADACLGYAPDGAWASLLPPEIRPAVLGRHEPFARRKHRDGLMVRHHLLGRGRDVQGAPGRAEASHVLLAQFDTDEGMFWMWGDCGVLQVWITPEDLAARRFERCVTTLEGH
jgi:hypothetical protein